jgi:phenylalanyl-tRNA synthetase beta chain
LEIRIAGGQPAAVRYQPLPTQPALVRDLSLVLPAGVTAAAVKDVLRREGGALLERLEVLDEYRGPGLPEGTRGVTWRCTFRDPEGTRTLTDREVDALLSQMLKALEVQLDVRRRSA